MVGLAPSEGVLPLPVAASAQNSRDYQVMVPAGSPHNVMVTSPFFKLTVSVTAAANGVPAVVSVKVAGAGK
jgi:hypothetical protein